MSKIAGALLLIAGSLLVGLLVIEGVMEIMGIRYDRLWEPDPQLGWRSIPQAERHWTDEGDGWVHVNTLGHRDRERNLGKQANTFRIAVFGDSMTEAVQVNLDKTFTYLLEDSLDINGQKTEVLNLGVTGYSPIQELLLFKEEGSRYRPDLVVLAVFLDNDIADCHPKLTLSPGRAPVMKVNGQDTLFDYKGAEHSYEDYHRQPFDWLRQHSRIYRLIATWRWRMKQIAEKGERGATGPVETKVPTRFLLYQKPLQPEWEEAWRVFERVITEFSAEADRLNAKFVVLSVPVSFVVKQDIWAGLLRSNPAMQTVTWDLEGPDRRLQAITEAHGIPLLTAYPFFRKVNSTEPLFYGDIGHFTPRGHEVMASFLREYFLNGEPSKNGNAGMAQPGS